jgi:hypothetical protein
VIFTPNGTDDDGDGDDGDGDDGSAGNDWTP